MRTYASDTLKRNAGRKAPMHVRAAKRRAPFRRVMQTSKTPQLTLISAAVLLAMGASRNSFALPSGEQVSAGQATIQRPSASSMVINQAAPKAVVNWQSFSIGQRESVDVRQPSASAVLLNRVVGVDASSIQGRLTANGQVFLLNPNGILFGPTSQVTVGGIVASTLSMTDKDFYSGNYKLTGTGKPGSVQIQAGAQITAHDHGYIGVLGGEVSNEGTLTAKLGTVALAAGDSVTLDFAGDGLTKIKVDKAALDAVVANHGAIIADGGQAIMTVNSSLQLAQTVVNQSGVIRAQSLLERDGRIILASLGQGDVMVSGTVDASGPAAGTTGGTVHVSGDRVGIVDHGSIDASGAAGGGEVLIGGGLHGNNPDVRNASATYVGPNANVYADATTTGNGGTVAVWSDGPTRAFGSISARGAGNSGDGGLVETSGKFLDVTGIRVDTSSPKGKSGTWLLDPFNVTITNGDANDVEETDNDGETIFTALGDTQIGVTIIENALRNSDVRISTGQGGQEGRGDITWLTGADLSALNGVAHTLTLQAAHNIDIGVPPAEPGPVIFAATSLPPLPSAKLKIAADGPGALNFNLSANSTITLQEGVQIFTNGGDVRMGAGAAVDRPTERVSIAGTSANPVAIDTRRTQDPSTGGLLTVLARSVEMQQTRISTANGAVTVDTGGDPGFGITLTDTSIETTSGEVKLLDGPVASGSGAGIALDADFLNAPDSLTQISTDSGKITISGAANGDTSGVRIGHAKLSSTSGDIEIRGESTQSWGVQMDSSASQIASGGASIHISSGSSISLGNGANITATGSDPTTLHIETDRSLSVGSSVQVAADSGPLTVQLEAGRNQGFGNISIQDGANISTRGGGVTIGSGAESELRLNGTNAAPIKIDTATNAGDHIGDVIIKSSSGRVLLQGTRITGSGDISVEGHSGDAVQIRGSVLDATSGKNITITGTTSSGSCFSGTGVILSADFLDSQDTFAESAIKTAGGTVQVTGTTTNSGTGVDITGVKISSKTGNITIEGDTGSFSTAVSVGPSSRNAQIVSEIASSAPSVQIIGDGSIKLLNGTKVKKTKDASDPTTLLVQAGDDISIDTKVEISSDGGVLNVDLDAGHDASGSISIASGTTIKTRGGSVTLHSSADADVHGAEFIRMFGQDGRIDIDTRLTGSDTDKTGGEVTLLADGQRQIFGLEGGSPARIHLDNVDIKSASGNVTLTSRAQPKANGATEGVALLSSTITTTQGKISIDSAAEQIAIGVRIAANSAQSATSALNTGSGDISIRGTAGSADHPIVLPSIGVAIGDPETPSLKPTIMTTGGKIEIIGVAGSSHQQSIGVQIVDANVNSATSLTVDGTAQGEITRGEGFYAGVQILSTTLTSGSGVLLIRGTGHDGSQGVDGKPGSQSDGVLPGEDGESGGFGASGVVIDHSTITASSEISIEGTGGRGGDGGQGGAGWNNDSSTGVGGDAGSGGSGGHGGSGIDVSNSTLSAQSKIAMDGKGGAGGNGGPGGVGGAGNNGGGGGFPGDGGLGGGGGEGVLFFNSTLSKATETVTVTGHGGAGGNGGAGGAGGDGSIPVVIELARLAVAVPAQGDATDGGAGGAAGAGATGVEMNISTIDVPGAVTVHGTGGAGGHGGDGGAGGLGRGSGNDGVLGLAGFGGDGAPGFSSSGSTIKTHTTNDILIEGISGVGGAAGSGNDVEPADGGFDAAGIFGDFQEGGLNLTLASEAGDIKVHGYSLSANRSSKTDRIAGVFMVSLHATTTEGGMIEIAGGRERGCADCLISGKNLERGVELGRGSVIQTAGDGSISITGDVPAGVAVQLRGAQIGGTDQTGSIVLRGNGGTFLGGAIQVDPQASIRTSGVVDFRPGFVHSDTSTGELPRTEVAYVDSEQLTSGAFTVDARALTSIKGTTIPGAIVLGSDQQQGAIRIDTTLNLPALAANLGALNLTLQNGAGTGGISINAPLTVGGTLALVSAGGVGQGDGATITAPNLVLLGVGKGADFALSDRNLTPRVVNSINTLAASTEGAIVFDNQNTVTLSALPWHGIVSETNAQTLETLSAFGAGRDFFVRSVAGEMRLGQRTDGDAEFTAARVARFAAAAFDPSAITINTGGDVVLVGATNFVNSVTTTLNTGGRFIIATKSPDLIVAGNIVAGNKTPNVYNCGLASGTCTIPTDGNHFLFTDQVFAEIQVANATRMTGQPNPQFSFTATGLRNGDSMSDLTTGKPVTQAGTGSNAGDYPITLDSTFSPANYTLTVRPGVLRVDVQSIIPDVYHVPTDAPDAALTLPQICTSIAAAPVAYSESDGGDAVDREWSKVKQRLMLSSCTGVRMKESCGDF